MLTDSTCPCALHINCCTNSYASICEIHRNRELIVIYCRHFEIYQSWNLSNKRLIVHCHNGGDKRAPTSTPTHAVISELATMAKMLLLFHRILFFDELFINAFETHTHCEWVQTFALKRQSSCLCSVHPRITHTRTNCIDGQWVRANVCVSKLFFQIQIHFPRNRRSNTDQGHWDISVQWFHFCSMAVRWHAVMVATPTTTTHVKLLPVHGQNEETLLRFSRTYFVDFSPAFGFQSLQDFDCRFRSGEWHHEWFFLLLFATQKGGQRTDPNRSFTSPSSIKSLFPFIFLPFPFFFRRLSCSVFLGNQPGERLLLLVIGTGQWCHIQANGTRPPYAHLLHSAETAFLRTRLSSDQHASMWILNANFNTKFQFVKFSSDRRLSLWFGNVLHASTRMIRCECGMHACVCVCLSANLMIKCNDGVQQNNGNSILHV